MLEALLYPLAILAWWAIASLATAVFIVTWATLCPKCPLDLEDPEDTIGLALLWPLFWGLLGVWVWDRRGIILARTIPFA